MTKKSSSVLEMTSDKKGDVVVVENMSTHNNNEPFLTLTTAAIIDTMYVY